MAFTNHHLKIAARTWTKDSYGLFDYETTQNHSQNLKITESCNFYRVDQDVNFVSTNRSNPNQKPVETMTNIDSQETLANITQLAGGFKISWPSTNLSSSQQIWQKMDNFRDNDKGHLLRAGDVLKLGRTILKIKTIKIQGEAKDLNIYRHSIFNSIKQHNDKNLIFQLNPDCMNSENQKGLTCKICLGERADEDDPLVSPCNCSGSVSHVHIKCLQSWISNRLGMQKNKNVININWQKLRCELCKSELPLVIKHQGEEFLLVSSQQKRCTSYAVLEFFSKENESSGIFVIDTTSNGRFKIGRGTDCDLLTTDISISRVHAILSCNNGKLYVHDNNSRFGTLLQLRTSLLLHSDNLRSPWLQCGRTSFQLYLDKPWISWIPCIGSIFNTHKEENIKSSFLSKIDKVDTKPSDDEGVVKEDDISRKGSLEN